MTNQTTLRFLSVSMLVMTLGGFAAGWYVRDISEPPRIRMPVAKPVPCPPEKITWLAPGAHGAELIDPTNISDALYVHKILLESRCVRRNIRQAICEFNPV